MGLFFTKASFQGKRQLEYSRLTKSVESARKGENGFFHEFQVFVGEGGGPTPQVLEFQAWDPPFPRSYLSGFSWDELSF